MPSSGEHNRPLRLVCGQDGWLVAAEYAMAAASVLFIAVGGLVPELKLLLASLAMAFLRLSPGTAPVGSALRVTPNGSFECAGVSGHVQPAAWVSRHYTVLRLDQGHRRRSLLVSASRQAPDEYRKLLSWLRLGRWQD